MSTISATWTKVASTERLSRSSQALSVVGGAAYIFGGEVVPRQPVDNSLDIVTLSSSTDVSAQTLPAPSDAPTPRVGSPSTTINGFIWLFSGRGGLEMKPIEENGALWRYDTKAAQWNLVKPANSSAPFPAGRSYHCITSDNRNKIYIHAGCPESGRLADLWEFDAETKTWSELPSAPGSARGGASITFLQDKLYRINGFDGKTEQGGALDVFDIPGNTWTTVTYNADGVQGPEARSVATLLPVVLADKAYLVTVFGEHDPSSLGHAGAGKMLANGWAWDLESAKWNKISASGDIPEPRGWFDADVLDGSGNSAVIVHGGLNEDNKRLGDVWKLSFGK